MLPSTERWCWPVEPSALRAPDGFTAPRSMGPSGAHLPATLHDLAQAAQRDHPGGERDVYARVANKLSELVENVRGITVDVDDKRQLLSIVMTDLQDWAVAGHAVSYRSAAVGPRAKELLVRANSVRDGARLVPRLLLMFVLVAFVAGAAPGAQVPAGTPEDVGLSAGRLQRIGEMIQRAIDAEQISGAVTVVARRGRVAHFEAHGLMDVEANAPMRKDTIFPIASMTKPVTGVAILMLVEEGKVRLSDPVSRFIPEFRDTKVAMPPSSAAGEEDGVHTVPAEREITVRDLITHTSGLGSGGAGSEATSRIAPRKPTDTVAGWAAALGAAPLDFQPGSRWAYSGLAGIDTLGRIVEVASGLTFDEFLRRQIFEPLGMKDTTFNVPDTRKPRVVTLYRRTPDGLERRPAPEWVATTSLHSGGGGLWSTAEDYLQFAQMLVNNGELNGTRLLGSRTVDLMASNHVGDLYARAGRTGGGSGKGFGLTVDVVLDAVEARGDHRSTGSFGWSGAFGTTFWVDPKADLTAILMVQTPGGPLRADFQNAVRQAIVD